jgi:hypothetical protein
MSRSVVAAVISALVFPGAGQFYLRRRARACLFAVPAAACAIYFVRQMLAQVMPMVDQIAAGAMALDPVAIAAQLERQGGTARLNAAIIIMVLCWLASIADAWWCGRATDVAKMSTGTAI